MGGVGARLLTIRRPVATVFTRGEKRTRCLAQAKGNQSYHVSASWLHRLEREEHELSVSKLMAWQRFITSRRGNCCVAFIPEADRT